MAIRATPAKSRPKPTARAAASVTVTTETTAPLGATTESPFNPADPTTSVPAYLVNSNLPAELQALETKGDFKAAEQWLETQIATASPTTSSTQSTSSAAPTTTHLSAELARLRHLQRDYNATAAEILAKLRKEIPTVTTADLDLWRNAGAIQWIPVNREPRYFRREPGNLLRFDKRAQAMQKAAKKSKSKTAKGDPAAASKKFDLNPHLAKAIAAARDTKTSLVLPITFHVRHVIAVKPGVVPPGETIRCWFPYPQAYRQQQEPTLKTSSPASPKISASGTLMRTAYLEQPANAADKPTTFTLEYEYKTSAFYPDITRPSKKPRDPAPADFLAEQPPHIVFTPELRALAADIVGTATQPLDKAQRIWSWIDLNIKWAAEMEYATLPNIVQKVSTCMRGDCGTQSLFFVTLCRISGIPARWQSGWVTKPKDWNMHDWSEFYTPGFGWLPADPSVGRRKSKTPAVRDYMFGHLDAYRMIANLDWGKPFDPPKTFDRSDPVDNQRGEVEWSGGNLYYDDWTYEVEVK